MDARPVITETQGFLPLKSADRVLQNGTDESCVPVKSLSPEPLLTGGDHHLDDTPEPARNKRKVSFHDMKTNQGRVGDDVPKTQPAPETLFLELALDRPVSPPGTSLSFFISLMNTLESPSNLLILYFWGREQGIESVELENCKSKLVGLLISDLLNHLYSLLPGLGHRHFKDSMAVALYCRKRQKEDKANGSDIDRFLREKLSWIVLQTVGKEEERELRYCYEYLKIFSEDPVAFISGLINDNLRVEILFRQVIQDAKEIKSLARSEPRASSSKM